MKSDPILIPTYRTLVWPWSDEMVREFYDMHLREMAGKSGHPIDKLKEILLSK